MEFLDLVPILVGALLTLAGVGISEYGQSRRAARAESAARRSELEARRVELWQISLPAATRIREAFAKAARAATREDPWGPEEPHWDEESFESWWYGEEQQVSRDIALIPSASMRRDLQLVAKAVSFTWALTTKVGYKPKHQSTAASLGQLGFDLISTWMRDELTPDDELREHLKDVEAKLEAVDEILASEN